MGRPTSCFFSNETCRARATRAEFARQSTRDEDRYLAERRADRRDPLSRTTGRRGFPEPGFKVRADQSTHLRRRMHRRDLFAPEKRIRHAAEASAFGHCAIKSHAGDAEARPNEFAKPGKTLRQARGRIRALD